MCVTVNGCFSLNYHHTSLKGVTEIGVNSSLFLQMTYRHVVKGWL